MRDTHSPPNDPEQAALLFAESYFALLGLPPDASREAVLDRAEEYRSYIARNWRTAELRALSSTYNDVYLKKIKSTFGDPEKERKYRKLKGGKRDGKPDRSGVPAGVPRVVTIIALLFLGSVSLGWIGDRVRATAASAVSNAGAQAIGTARNASVASPSAIRHAAYRGQTRTSSKQKNVVATPAASPPETAGIDPDEAAKFVRDYYDLWNKRDFQTMYGMLSPAMQQKYAYADYVKYHGMVQHIDVDVTPTATGSIVHVRITSQDLETDGSITESVNVGQWYLSTENGQLRLASESVHELGPQDGEAEVQSSAASHSEDAVAFVRAYYRLWNARDFQSMYEMLSPKMQQQNSYPDYVKYHSMVQHIDVDAEPTTADNVVDVRITSHDLEADGTVTESVNVGQWYLIRNGDGLELDAQDVHDVTASGT